MVKEKIIAALGSTLLKKMQETFTEKSEEYIDQLIDKEIKEYKLEKYKKSLDENILKKYGDEIFYDDLCNILLCDGNIDELIKRCSQRNILDDETNDEFLERIMKNASMNVYNKALVKEVLEYIEEVTFQTFNELKASENVILKNIILKEEEKTRHEVKKIHNDLRDLTEKERTSEHKPVKENPVFITKGCKGEVKHFKGRGYEIKEIIEIIEKDKVNNRKTFLWMYGMGGLGKTQLCRKINSIVQSQYSYVGWIVYQDDFKHSLVNSMNVWDKTDDLNKEYEKSVRYINSLGRQLLLFIDNYDAVDSYIGDVESLQCHVVVTSRNKNPDTFSGYKLGFLDFAACKELFCHFYTLEDNMIINEIIHRTGYLSLAVELVAKTGQKLGMTLENYYLKLEEKGFDLSTIVQSNWDNNGKKLNVELSRHFSIVFDLMALGKNIEAMYILKNFSILPYLGVSHQEAVEWLNLDKDSGVLYDLVDSGWLQQVDLEYTMHPVISFTVQQMISPSLEDCINLVTALSLCILVEPGDNYLRSFYYLPYAETVGSYFAKDKFLSKNKIAILPVLFIRIAEINRHNGDYNKAYKWGRKSCECLHDLHEKSGKLLNLVYNVMSEICLDMRDRNDETRDWALRAVESDRDSEDIDNTERGTSFHNLAGAYIQMGDNEKALDYEQEALELRKSELQEGDIRLINCQRNIAMIYRRSGHLDLALEYYETVIAGLEKIHQDDMNHPDFPVVYNLFSFVLRDLGRMEEAIEYQEKAMKIREFINEEDPKLAINYNNLGMFHLQNNSLEEAIKWERKAMEMDLKNRGFFHPDVATDFFNYAKILYVIGNKKEAIQYLKKSRAIEEKIGQSPENIEQIDKLLVLYLNDETAKSEP